MKVMIYGYGNPGRRDDGMGVALVKMLEDWAYDHGLAHLDFDINYQLNIEEAHIISKYDAAIFADASDENIEGFVFTKVEPSANPVNFTMHEVSAAYVVSICKELFHKNPKVYLIHLRGHEWQLEEGLTQQAGHTVGEAFKFMSSILITPPDELLKVLDEHADVEVSIDKNAPEA